MYIDRTLKSISLLLLFNLLEKGKKEKQVDFDQEIDSLIVKRRKNKKKKT